MAISDPDFDFIRDLVCRYSALVLDEGKQYLVESRLQPVATKAGLETIANLVVALRKDTDKRLRTQVIEAMTTNETSFFRDLHPFLALRSDIIPKLIEARSKVRSLTIWCAASSSGQEPYSLAITLKEHFPQLQGWKLRIICTDISEEMLSRTKAGAFSQIEVNRGLPAPMLVKYFTQQGSTWVIDPELRKIIEVKQLNLAEPFPLMPEVDLVFLRNVLIYFSPETKQDILSRVYKVIKPDGYLLLGSTETMLSIKVPFERLAIGKSSFYIKTLPQ